MSIKQHPFHQIKAVRIILQESVCTAIFASNSTGKLYTPVDMHGRMPQSVRERYLKMKEAPDHPANLDVLIQNFDCALSHPDADDLERLRQAVRNSSF